MYIASCDNHLRLYNSRSTPVNGTRCISSIMVRN